MKRAKIRRYQKGKSILTFLSTALAFLSLSLHFAKIFEYYFHISWLCQVWVTDMRRCEAQSVQMAHVWAFCPSEVFPSSDACLISSKASRVFMLWLLIFKAKDAIRLISIYTPTEMPLFCHSKVQNKQFPFRYSFQMDDCCQPPLFIWKCWVLTFDFLTSKKLRCESIQKLEYEACVAQIKQNNDANRVRRDEGFHSFRR